jgi:hypothetical protein
MATLRHPNIVGPRARPQRRRAGSSIGHLLLIGRDLLFALWATAVLAFWLLIIASFAL